MQLNDCNLIKIILSICVFFCFCIKQKHLNFIDDNIYYIIASENNFD